METLEKRTIFTAQPYVEVSQSTIDIDDGRIIDDFTITSPATSVISLGQQDALAGDEGMGQTQASAVQ